MRLILIRHAKSSWDQPSLSDHDRPLAKRGVRSASAIGKWLSERDYIPEIVLCSTARRTRQTWRGISEFIVPKPDVRYCGELYHGNARAMLNALRSADGASAMLIGHNPSTAQFAGKYFRNLTTTPNFGDGQRRRHWFAIFPAIDGKLPSSAPEPRLILLFPGNLIKEIRDSRSIYAHQNQHSPYSAGNRSIDSDAT